MDFHDPRTHGFVRVGAATPLATVGDPAANAEETLALARLGHERGVDVIVYPELNLSSYAIDDLHMQDALLRATREALETVRKGSTGLRPLLLVGAGLERRSRLYNCAIAVHRGRVLGAVPKSFLPNYREFYEKRLFAPGVGLTGLQMEIGAESVPFGTDLLFEAEGASDLVVHVEICEDYWAPIPPSCRGALAGATLLANLSASNIVIGKARERDLLSESHTARTVSALVYSAAGPGESTTDLAWDGQGGIYELGDKLASSTRFDTERELLVADVDVGRVRQNRLRMGTFNDGARAADDPEHRFRRVRFALDPSLPGPLVRDVPRFPFVPADPEKLDEDCFEAFNIQVEGLAKRLRASGSETAVIGVSGGLDSTHALIVTAKAFDRLRWPRERILGFTLPGFATGDTTKGNAWALMRAMGCSAEEIDITEAARTMLGHMGHPFADGEPTYDVTFENVQAGLRTDYLFRLANQRRGIVVGTGDLSEMALGWCTYGVGDQMSHYAVNTGVPKTLIQHLIRWSIATGQFDDAKTDEVLGRILDTEISPELVPAGEDGEIQSTEDRIGPYALHDFFVHHAVRHGMAPSKIAFLALRAWGDAERGAWPRDFPAEARVAHDLGTVRKWLEVFVRRFYGFSQFKRSAIPNGPKVSSAAALSPRGDWRAPSDGTAAAWLRDIERVPEA